MLTHKAAKKFQLSAENSRKFVHIVMGLTVALFPFIFEHTLSVWILAFLSLAFFYSIRRYQKMSNSFGDALYRIERKSYGEVYYTLAVALTFTFAPDTKTYILTIFILSFSDAIASLVGTRYGTCLFSFRNNIKSFEGSLSFFVTTFVLALLFTQALAFSLFLALVLTVVELLSTKGIDNLLLPLFTLLVFHFFALSSTTTLLLLSFIMFIVLYSLCKYFHIYSIKREDDKLSLEHKGSVLASVKMYDNSIFGELTAKSANALESLLKLLQKSHSELIGPMDGSTWKSYRAVTYSDGREPFLLEPRNPTFFPSVFEKLGFKVQERYFSSVVPLHSAQDERIQRVKSRLEEHGIIIRNIDLDNFEEELKSLYDLSCEAFKDNPYYTHISQEEFFALYMPYKETIPAELVQLVYLNEQLIGYMFALIDKQNLIIKTTAFKPLKASAGTTLVLIDNLAKYALKLGCTDLIYALMHEDNHSAKTANKNAKVFRRYALYKWSEE